MIFFRNKAGFSILEILITAAIIGMITTVIVVKYGSFNNAVLLKSQAYEIALDLREAQMSAVSAIGDAGTFRQDYGLYFDVTLPGQYQLFLDSTNLYEYGTNAAYFEEGEEIGLPQRLDSRFEIYQICVNNCSVIVEDLSVSFMRPNFDAQFSSRDARDQGTGLISDAVIWISNAVGTMATRTVEIISTGQINVN